MMRNVFKFLGIVAVAAVIGFSMIACGEGGGGGGGGGDAFAGTWNGTVTQQGITTTSKIVASGGNFTMSMSANNNQNGVAKGTYKISGNNVSLTATEVDSVQIPLAQQTTFTGTISGNKFTVNQQGQFITFTKQ